jgi:hypothetical protein
MHLLFLKVIAISFGFLLFYIVLAILLVAYSALWFLRLGLIVLGSVHLQ